MRCANIRIRAEIPVVEEAGYLRFHDHNNVVYSIEAIQKACEKASDLPIIKYDEHGVEQVVGVAQSIKWNPNGFIEVDGTMLFGGTNEAVELGENNDVVSMKFSAMEEYIDSGSIPEWFTNTIADYTDDDCNRGNDIGWLMNNALSGIASIDGGKLTFSSDTSLFKGKHAEFVKAAEQLAKTSFDDFLSNYAVRTVLFNLTEAYDDRYGFYVYNSDDDSLDTLDDFMRGVRDGDTYYIGGVIDYHY